MRKVGVTIAGLLGLLAICAPTAGSAQTIESQRPQSAIDAPSAAASPYNARYIPGVGFRYVYPGGPQVYGYVRYARGYRAKRCGAHAVWNGEACVSKRRWIW